MNEEVDKAIREAMARYPEKAKSYSEAFLKSNMIMNVAQEVSKIVDERDRQLNRIQNWHLLVAEAIRDLLEMKDDKKKWFFDKQGYWYAVYEVLIEEGFIPKGINEEQFISDYCTDTSPHYILPRDNDQLRNPYRIGALKNNKPVNTANEMRKARREEIDEKSGDEKFPNVDLFKDKFRELLVKNGVIKP